MDRLTDKVEELKRSDEELKRSGKELKAIICSIKVLVIAPCVYVNIQNCCVALRLCITKLIALLCTHASFFNRVFGFTFYKKWQCYQYTATIMLKS